MGSGAVVKGWLKGAVSEMKVQMQREVGAGVQQLEGVVVGEVRACQFGLEQRIERGQHEAWEGATSSLRSWLGAQLGALEQRLAGQIAGAEGRLAEKQMGVAEGGSCSLRSWAEAPRHSWGRWG